MGRENAYKTSETLCFWGFSLPSNLYGMSRNVVEICGYVAGMQYVYIKNHSNSKLKRLVDMSNVQEVERVEKERIDAVNVVAKEKKKTFMTKKNCREEIDKVNKKANKKIADMKNKIQFWKMVAIGTLAVGILIGWIL